MYEKILALLAAKFAQARKDGLQQLARSLAIQVADETEAQALVEKITDDKVTTFIKDWRKEVDAEVTKSTKTFEDTLKSKYDMVEKKNPTPPTPKIDDNTPEWAKALIEQNKKLADEVAGIKSGKTTDVRRQTLEAKLKDAPEAFKKSILKNFGRMAFETEEEFDEFITETETDLNTAIQEAANNGLGSFPKPGSPAGGNPTKTVVENDIKNWAEKSKPKGEA
ncbi:MAG: hypothetical protein WCK78_04240 [Paludibacter sp.]